MNVESNRLNTFTNWPSSAPVDPIRIAKAGFFYTGEGTEVQCFSCGGKISDWNYGDQVMWRHRRMEPQCQFVLNSASSGNVPLVLGNDCPSVPSTISLSNAERLISFNRTQDEQLESQDYGLTDDDEMYKCDALRLLSFVNWEDSSVSRESLVNAGFYHVGEGRLRCAWCGGELDPFRNFGSLGTPLEVHRTYFPRCAHAASVEAMQRSSAVSSQVETPSYSPPVESSPEQNQAQPTSEGAVQNTAVLECAGTWRALGVVGAGRAARHPTHATLPSRLATFERWPAKTPQTPRALAEAGFFYTGVDDQVRCFYCDGGLGKWEASDAPWAEHARWFPHCQYVLLVKGQPFVDSQKQVPRAVSTDTGLSARQRDRQPSSTVEFPFTEAQVEACMDSHVTMAALAAGLDAARVRRAIVRRLRSTGSPFTCAEGLIDAVLDGQLGEEAWSTGTRSQRLARDILAETLRDLAPGILPASNRSVYRSEENRSQSESTSRSTSPEVSRPQRIPVPTLSQGARIPNEEQRNQNVDRRNQNVVQNYQNGQSDENIQGRNEIREELGENVVQISENVNIISAKIDGAAVSKKPLTLEEENRQLKEARLCKVCMDNEVSVVFLPCGHLVSCAGCGAALPACPLCRAPVRALVRAYLA